MAVMPPSCELGCGAASTRHVQVQATDDGPACVLSVCDRCEVQAPALSAQTKGDRYEQDTLRMIADDELTAGEVAERLGTNGPTANGVLKRLEAEGRVERLPDPGPNGATVWALAGASRMPVATLDTPTLAKRVRAHLVGGPCSAGALARELNAGHDAIDEAVRWLTHRAEALLDRGRWQLTDDGWLMATGEVRLPTPTSKEASVPKPTKPTELSTGDRRKLLVAHLLGTGSQTAAQLREALGFTSNQVGNDLMALTTRTREVAVVDMDEKPRRYVAVKERAERLRPEPKQELPEPEPVPELPVPRPHATRATLTPANIERAKRLGWTPGQGSDVPTWALVQLEAVQSELRAARGKLNERHTAEHQAAEKLWTSIGKLTGHEVQSDLDARDAVASVAAQLEAHQQEAVAIAAALGIDMGECDDLVEAVRQRAAMPALKRGSVAAKAREMMREALREIREKLGLEPDATYEQVVHALDCALESDVRARQAVDAIERLGHTGHCAARLAWGDGECECGGRALPWPELVEQARRRAGPWNIDADGESLCLYANGEWAGHVERVRPDVGEPYWTATAWVYPGRMEVNGNAGKDARRMMDVPCDSAEDARELCVTWLRMRGVEVEASEVELAEVAK